MTVVAIDRVVKSCMCCGIVWVVVLCVDWGCVLWWCGLEVCLTILRSAPLLHLAKKGDH